MHNNRSSLNILTDDGKKLYIRITTLMHSKARALNGIKDLNCRTTQRFLSCSWCKSGSKHLSECRGGHKVQLWWEYLIHDKRPSSLQKILFQNKAKFPPTEGFQRVKKKRQCFASFYSSKRARQCKYL